MKLISKGDIKSGDYFYAYIKDDDEAVEYGAEDGRYISVCHMNSDEDYNEIYVHMKSEAVQGDLFVEMNLNIGLGLNYTAYSLTVDELLGFLALTI